MAALCPAAGMGLGSVGLWHASLSFIMLNLFKSRPQQTQKSHFAYKKDTTNKMTVSLGPLARPPVSGFHESVEAAREVALDQRRKKIALCLSGGIDSECMLRSFLQARVEFEVLFLRFKDQLNWFDIQTNVALCDSLQISYSFVELDIIHFFETEKHLSYGKKYSCQSPQIAAHLWMLDQIDNSVPVLAGNPFVKTQLADSVFFVGLPGDLHCAYFRYFDSNRRAGVPWFFIYTPEQCAAFLRTPTAISLQRSALGPESFTYKAKCQIYQEAFYKVSPRADKYTGFELVRGHYDRVFQTTHGQGFDKNFREPLEKMNPFPETYIQRVPQNYFYSS